MRNSLSRKTILNVLGTLRSMLQRARAWNYQVKTFEYADVTLPPDEVHDQVWSYTTDESLLLIENAPSLKWKGCATAQLQAGASIVTVKENLGHAKIETTLRYTHTISGDQRDAVNRLAALFERRRAETAEFCGVLRRNVAATA